MMSPRPPGSPCKLALQNARLLIYTNPLSSQYIVRCSIFICPEAFARRHAPAEEEHSRLDRPHSSFPQG